MYPCPDGLLSNDSTITTLSWKLILPFYTDQTTLSKTQTFKNVNIQIIWWSLQTPWTLSTKCKSSCASAKGFKERLQCEVAGLQQLWHCQSSPQCLEWQSCSLQNFCSKRYYHSLEFCILLRFDHHQLAATSTRSSMYEGPSIVLGTQHCSRHTGRCLVWIGTHKFSTTEPRQEEPAWFSGESAGLRSGRLSLKIHLAWHPVSHSSQRWL